MITLSKGRDVYYPILRQGIYSDGTPMVKVDDFSAMVRHTDTMTIRYEDMSEFVTAMFLVDAIRAHDGHIRNLILPYVPGARQDRSNPDGDVLITLASVAQIINNRMFGRVVILDPHSEKTTQLVHRAVVYPQFLVSRGLRDLGHHGIIATDKGGKARAEAMAKALRLPVFYGGKTRDTSTGRLSGFTLEPIPYGHYLVVDDICDGGGTFIGLADKIHEQGSTADLFVSHGIFAKGTRGLLDRYGMIYTTDSLIGSDCDSTVTVLPLIKEMESYDG
jgi:ribose-phosphate pyrophosphokinase